MPSGRTEVQVRPGIESDLDALVAIYNHYVRETPNTSIPRCSRRKSAALGCSPTLKTARTA